ncbi:MAG UNVERIFIED_CONTAM: transposase [Microcystis novacekii LVE1205-3]
MVIMSKSTRTHVCPHCGYVEDRDMQSSYLDSATPAAEKLILTQK